MRARVKKILWFNHYKSSLGPTLRFKPLRIVVPTYFSLEACLVHAIDGSHLIMNSYLCLLYKQTCPWKENSTSMEFCLSLYLITPLVFFSFFDKMGNFIDQGTSENKRASKSLAKDQKKPTKMNLLYRNWRSPSAPWL